MSINVTQAPYNATGNGSTDDTAAIQAALTAASAGTGTEVYFPSGTYKTTAPLNIGALTTVQGLQIRGDGRGNTRIAPSGSYNALTVNGSNWVTIEGITILPIVTQTSGAAIATNGTSNLTVKDCSLRSTFNGMTMNADGNFLIDNVDLFGTVNDGFVVTGAGFGSMRNITMQGLAPVGSNTGSGFRIVNTGGIFMDSCDATLFSIGMNLAPVVASDAVSWLSINNSDFDTNGVALLVAANAASTYGTQGCVFNGCWFASSHTAFTSATGEGIRVTGTASGLEFNACRIVNNKTHGVNLLGGQKIFFDGCLISGNSTSASGVSYGFTSSINDFALRNSYIGQFGFFLNSQQGIQLVGNLSGFTVANNRLGNNTNALTATGSYSNFVWTNNTGLPVSMISPAQNLAFGTSPFTYTNTSPQTISIVVSGGVVNSIGITRGGTTIGTGLTQGQFTLSPNDSIIVSAGVAPTVTMFWIEL